ncbi:gliding motility-associated C-terminal domain-containing protein [Taibaiella chishuiensis]|uniref:Gliding motility-associated-like protein n=1 Tax=Taibaiella chishuiensis TaxID=1434707 RepID=A0A2P8D7F2_9BACT|nr:gliding motility-associated C-terminal domain-containing protein [Taibaiella chishuiensis]PSK93154.1 gliding motility-associated-like protein [Taibaiella chishuiensis]
MSLILYLLNQLYYRLFPGNKSINCQTSSRPGSRWGTLLFLILLFSGWNARAQFHAQRRQELKANSNWFHGAHRVDCNQEPPVSIEAPGYFPVAKRYERLRITDPLTPDFQTSFPGERNTNMIPVSHPLTGQFQFAVFPDQVYNRNFGMMPNGEFDPETFDPVTSDKHIAVVPFINDTNRYYIFNLGVEGTGLVYSVLDMRLDNGLGDIDPSAKAIPLKQWQYSYANFEVIGTVPGNNCNLWLLVAENLIVESSFNIYAFEITANGINTTPVTTKITKAFRPEILWDFQVSPDRKTIARIGLHVPEDTLTRKAASVNFLSFSPGTGQVGDSHLPAIDIPLHDFGLNIHGSFTPDNGFYMVNNGDYRPDKMLYLTRYDLSAYDNNYNPEKVPFALNYLILRQSEQGCPGVPPTLFFKPYNNSLYFNIPFGLKAGCPGGEGMKIVSKDLTAIRSLTGLGGRGWDVNGFSPDEIMLTVQNRFYTGNDVVYPYTPADTLPDLALDSVFCFDPTTPFPQLTLEAKAGYSNYVWNDGTAGPAKTVTQSGTYWVYYTGPCNTRVDSFRLRFRERKRIMPPDTVICDQRFPFDVRIGRAEFYLWDDNSTAQDRRIFKPGTYSVIFEALGCKQYDTLRVGGMLCPCNVSVPNAFSPNNDGLNDYFKPVMGLGCVPAQYSLRIYNRWGQLVYKSNNEFDRGWDGRTDNGTPADIGSYFYELRFNTSYRTDNYYHKGELILVR